MLITLAMVVYQSTFPQIRIKFFVKPLIPLPVCARQVLVTILDVNDYRPRFTERAFNTSVFENEPSGTSIITVRAVDLDEGENGAVLYSVLGPHAGVCQCGVNCMF